MSDQRLGTVVTCTHGHPFIIKGSRHIMGMKSINIKGNNTSMLIRIFWAINRQTFNCLKLRQNIVNQFLLVSMNIFHTQVSEVVHSSTKSNSSCNIRCPSLEFPRQFLPSSFLFVDEINHLTTKLNRIHLVENFFLAIKHTNSCWT